METFNVVVSGNQIISFRLKKTIGRLIKIKGFEKYKFFIHKTVDKSIFDYNYSCTHFDSGMRVGTADKCKDAIKFTQDILKTHGEIELNNLIKEHKLLFAKFKIKYPVNEI